MKAIKYSLATIIIIMGGYGYIHFFTTEAPNIPIWFVVPMFMILELALLSLTTLYFSKLKVNTIAKVGFFLSLFVMWMLSGVGIDQTIWSMVEDKYASINQAKTDSKVVDMAIKTKETEVKRLGLIIAKKSYYSTILIKQSKELNTIIYYNGRRCDTSKDCTSRKKVQEQLITTTMDSLNDIKTADKTLKVITSDLQALENQRQHLVSENNTKISNRSEGAVLLNVITKFLHHLGLTSITTAERGYVLLMSFSVYPIYIVFIIFYVALSKTDEVETELSEADIAPHILKSYKEK